MDDSIFPHSCVPVLHNECWYDMLCKVSILWVAPWLAYLKKSRLNYSACLSFDTWHDILFYCMVLFTLLSLLQVPFLHHHRHHHHHHLLFLLKLSIFMLTCWLKCKEQCNTDRIFFLTYSCLLFIACLHHIFCSQKIVAYQLCAFINIYSLWI